MLREHRIVLVVKRITVDLLDGVPRSGSNFHCSEVDHRLRIGAARQHEAANRLVRHASYSPIPGGSPPERLRCVGR